uniref:Trehalose 6-phosphate phosphatase n=1 Tax=Anopheles braziliensis TaxID=58242 RepID=A0A2M3Z5I9_9DIPT
MAMLLMGVLSCLILLNSSANPVISWQPNDQDASEMTAQPDYDQYLGEYLKPGDTLALLLDYDGTLAELMSHPSLAQMSEEMRQALRNIADSGKAFVAVISGRDVDGVKEKIGLENIIYSGNHGLEVLYPNGTRHNQGIPKDVAENFNKMIDHLNREVVHHGSWVENKRVSITFHFRETEQKYVAEMARSAKEIIESYGYRANEAHASIEGKPPVQWNKGLAAEYILGTSFDPNWRQRKVIFAGDDTTDEDVMRMIKGSGRSFRVTKDKALVTNADYKIPSVDAVYHLLKWIETRIAG